MPAQYPLTTFSCYLSGRNQVLLSIAREIVEERDPADPVSTRILLADYACVMASLNPLDGKMSHEDSFVRR
jgi:hypothetical protein